MKKNKMMRIASVLLVAVLLSTCAISGTFAKYTSTARGSDSATVAKWDVTVSDIELDTTANKTFAFNLFDTIVDTDTIDVDADDQVKAGMIAPGTKGEFSFVITNNSDVDAQFTLAFTKTGPAVPFTFKVTCTGQTEKAALEGYNDVDLAKNGGTVTITVAWEWPFDGDDTALGLASGDVTVQADVTVTQVD